MSTPRQGRTWFARLGAGLVVLIAVLGTLYLARTLAESRTSTSRAAPGPNPSSSATTVVTAGKTICPSITPRFLPPGLVPKDRNLVPYSHSTLGVDATWADALSKRSIEILSGGYVDDITEPYDGLVPASGARVNGAAVTVLKTVFLRRTVYLGYWREIGVDRPCDVHAVVTIGLEKSQAYAVLHSLR